MSSMWMFVRIDLNGPAGRIEALSPCRTAILEAIDRAGSISAAASAVNLTFSQTWRIVCVINSLCDKPMVAARRGGGDAGPFLTPLGKDVLARFREIERVINESAAPYIRELERVFGVDRMPPRVVRFAQIIEPSTIPPPKRKRAERSNVKQKTTSRPHLQKKPRSERRR